MGRKRISKEIIGEVIIDELAYSPNIGSKNAIKITDNYEQIHIELWFDKHYLNRVRFGDEDGQRKGIEEPAIQKLVSNSLSNLIHYSFLIKNFCFVNSCEPYSPSLRTVLQKETIDGVLNVVVGFYQIAKNKYEVTVFTAMVTDTFRISDGQYALFMEDHNSILYKMDNRKMVKISSNN